MTEPILLVGGGGHAKVVIDALRRAGRSLLGVVDPSLELGDSVLGVPVVGDDATVVTYDPDSIRLANGVGSTGRSNRRRHVFERLVRYGYSFVNVIHPAATVTAAQPECHGIQVMAGAVVQTGSVLGRNVLVNTKASVDHDCDVGEHVHIGPGATVCGGVTIETGAFIGAGAVITPGVRVGRDAVVGAGSVVLHDVQPGTTVAGVPARVIRR